MWPVVVCTEPFRTLADLNARGKGMAHLDLVVIPHPLGVRPVEQVEEIGRDVARNVLALLDSHARPSRRSR